MIAAIEIGALEARHVRAVHAGLVARLCAQGGRGARRVPARGAAQPPRRDAEWRTPWERNADHELIDYELGQVRQLRREPQGSGTDVGLEATWHRILSGKIAFVTGSGRGLGNVMAQQARGARRRRRRSRPQLGGDRPSTARPPTSATWSSRSRRWASRSMGVIGNIGDRDAVANMRKEIEEQVRPGRNPRQLRRRRHRRVGQQARSQQHPRHHLRGPDHADQQQPHRHHAGDAGLRAADGRSASTASSSTSPRSPPMSGYPHGGIYATLKAAVVHYTRCLAAEVRDARRARQRA